MELLLAFLESQLHFYQKFKFQQFFTPIFLDLIFPGFFVILRRFLELF